MISPKQAEVDCFIGNGRSCSKVLEEIRDMEDPMDQRETYQQEFCQPDTPITYVYRVCNEGAFNMIFKNSGQKPTRAALVYSPDDIEDIDQDFDVLGKYDGRTSCPYVFKHTLNPLECMEYPSTFIDVKGQLTSDSDGMNKLLERKFNGCWSRDEFTFDLGFQLLDPFEETDAVVPPAPAPIMAPTSSSGKGGKGGKGKEFDDGLSSSFFIRRRHDP